MKTVKFQFSLPADEAELLIDVIRSAAKIYREKALLDTAIAFYSLNHIRDWHLDYALLLDTIADIVTEGSS